MFKTGLKKKKKKKKNPYQQYLIFVKPVTPVQQLIVFGFKWCARVCVCQ